MKVGAGKRVTLEYELRTGAGEHLEASDDNGPLQYIHGDGKMLPALETRLEGLGAGEERKGVIPAAEAWGEEDNLPTAELSPKDFPAGEVPQVGKRFFAKDPASGDPLHFRVLKIEGEKISVRFVHPLGDQDIHYTVKIIEVCEPPSPPPIPKA